MRHAVFALCIRAESVAVSDSLYYIMCVCVWMSRGTYGVGNIFQTKEGWWLKCVGLIALHVI